MALDPTDPISRELRSLVDTPLHAFLDAKAVQLTELSESLTPLIRIATDLIAGGKRIRPAFGYWGHVAVTTEAAPEAIWSVLAAIEMLHLGVLVHDDVLDDSDTRRGHPSAHRQFAAWGAERGLAEAEQFGRELAVLLGDQLIVWSGEMASAAELDPAAWARARGLWHQMRSEVNVGQVLDIVAQYRMSQGDPEQLAEQVLEEKTSRYTVQRPLQLGAAIAGAEAEVQEALGAFGLALGRAFQLRDDLLGVFAPSGQTGKPEAGDLREVKRTVLLARAVKNLGADGAELESLLGPQMTDADVERAADLIDSSGAPAQLERLISADHDAALSALEHPGITPEGRTALTELARLCVERDY